MAFNFGAEEQVPLPPPPAPMKAEPGGYVVGQENGYAGVRVRIKSLKNVPKDIPAVEETPEVLRNKQLIDPAPVAPVALKQETARVIELKLFDLPPIEVDKEEIAIPAGETADSLSAEEETGFLEGGGREEEADSLPIEPESNIQASAEVNIPVATESNIQAEMVSVQVEIGDNIPDEQILPVNAPEEEHALALEISSPAIEITASALTVPAMEVNTPATITDNTPDIPPAVVTRKNTPPVSDTQPAGTPATIGADTGAPDLANSSISRGIGAAAASGVPGKPAKSKRGRKSLKEATAEADLIEVPGDDILFSKQYYTMRAVAEMFRVNQSLLRFWETEFDILQPRKNKKGDRYFRPVDIKNLHLIYHLLRQRKYTIEGAKEFLKTSKKADERFEAIQRLQEIRAFLLEWKAQL